MSDEGPGIPAAERDRVLEAFETGHRARTPGRGQGFGLGLTLARQVAEAHGGALTLGPARVEAGGERGCRVTLALPLAPR